MNQKELITVPLIGEIPHSPAITSEGEHIKTELLALSGAFLEVSTEHVCTQAAELAGRIKGHLDQVEGSREQVKSPFWKMCQEIDATKREHAQPLEEEMRRLNRLIGQFEQARREKFHVEQMARNAELDRLEKLRKEAALAEIKILTDLTPVEALGAQLDLEDEIAENKRKSDAILAESIREAEEAKKRQPAGALRHEIEIRVTDPTALYKAHPGLVILKPDLTGIKYFINHYLKEGETIPGVSFTKTPIFSAKAR